MLAFMVCHMLVLSWADYSFVMPFSAIAYALVPLLGYLFLGEQVSAARWIGIVLIVLGVFLINRTPPRTTRSRQAVELTCAPRSFSSFVVVTGTGGEICLTHAMKLLGEVHDFRPRAIAAFVLRALRVGWLWIGVLLMAAVVLFVSGDAVVVSGELRGSGDFARLRGRGVRRETLSGRAAERDALGGHLLICFGVAMAWVDDLPASLHIRPRCTAVPLGGSGAGARPAVFITSSEFIPRGGFSAWRTAAPSHTAGRA